MRQVRLLAGCVLVSGVLSAAGLATATESTSRDDNPLRLVGGNEAGGWLGMSAGRVAAAPTAPAAPSAGGLRFQDHPLMLTQLPATAESTESTEAAPGAPGTRTAAVVAEAPPPDAAAGGVGPAPLPLYTPPYRGGRGLITLQGMSGMFLNPTSGTLNQGQFTAQYCIFFNQYRTDVIGHGLMLDYGVTDWLDAGVFGTIGDVPGRDLFQEPLLAASGPFVRVRLLKDEGASSFVPELSVGGIYLDGGSLGDTFAKKEVFVAASKLFDVDPDGYLRSVRLHLGGRYLSRTEAPVPKDESYVYAGVELELPHSFYLVGELSSNNLNERGGEDLPYAVGVQWKPNSVLGISVAHMNPSTSQPALKDGFWFGIGLNFQF